MFIPFIIKYTFHKWQSCLHFNENLIIKETPTSTAENLPESQLKNICQHLAFKIEGGKFTNSHLMAGGYQSQVAGPDFSSLKGTQRSV